MKKNKSVVRSLDLSRLKERLPRAISAAFVSSSLSLPGCFSRKKWKGSVTDSVIQEIGVNVKALGTVCFFRFHQFCFVILKYKVQRAMLPMLLSLGISIT